MVWFLSVNVTFGGGEQQEVARLDGKMAGRRLRMWRGLKMAGARLAPLDE
jgi:hypothetical protein